MKQSQFQYTARQQIDSRFNYSCSTPIFTESGYLAGAVPRTPYGSARSECASQARGRRGSLHLQGPQTDARLGGGLFGRRGLPPRGWRRPAAARAWLLATRLGALVANPLWRLLGRALGCARRRPPIDSSPRKHNPCRTSLDRLRRGSTADEIHLFPAARPPRQHIPHRARARACTYSLPLPNRRWEEIKWGEGEERSRE
jgi:hypothetical protein